MNTKQEINAQLKILVFGAHPDDPETGCGGTILRLRRAGHNVVSVYLTRGEAGIHGKSSDETAQIRTKEAENACRILDVRLNFMDQIDGNCEINANEYEKTFMLIKKEEPDIAFTHWPIDAHRDHRVCSLLVFDSWPRLEKSFSLYYYEVMSGKQSRNFNPTDFVNIESILEEKRNACFAHKSQGMEYIYDMCHRPMEEFRGSEAGCKYAEAFIHQTQSPRILTPNILS